MGTRPLRVAAQLAAAGATLAASLCACSSGGSGPPADEITISSGSCGGNWTLAKPGWHTFEINNQGTGGAEVDLIDPADDAVYAEVENTGPATITPMSLDVGSGRYAFLCSFSDYNPTQGVTVTVPGHTAGTPAIMPITYNELLPLAKKYVIEEEAAIKVLAPETSALAAAVRSGNLATARRDWLTAHLQYETLGDAYGAFGNFDTEIDGRADAVGVNSPQWTGFFRLEYGLWHGQSLASLAPIADTLNKNVDQLAAWWPTQQITLSDLGRRAHEVIENAFEFQLTGHDDYGSGTTLASTAAAITASRVLLALLQPLLAPRLPGLPAVYTSLDQLQALLAKERQPDGWWVAESALTVSQRQAIDAACAQLLQELAPIAAITEPRNTLNAF